MAYTRKVQYYETDKMGIVHHSNYIRWFEEARTAYMLEKGIDYDNVEKDGIMMPVLGVECKYKHGAKYNEIVTIDTSVSFFNGIKLIFSYMVKNTDGDVLVTGSSTHCFVGLDFKPLRIKRTNPVFYDSINSLLEK